LGSACKKAARKMVVKLTPGLAGIYKHAGKPSSIKKETVE